MLPSGNIPLATTGTAPAPTFISTLTPTVGIAPVRPTVAKQTRINLAWQIALDAANFSPGVIDGKFGPKSKQALAEYTARYFPAGTSGFDKKVYEALKVDVDNAAILYTITSEDAAQVGPLPEDWNEKAKLDRLAYESLYDLVAEKFRCSKSLIASLNSTQNMAALRVGSSVIVPNVTPFLGTAAAKAARPDSMDADYIAINLTEKAIRVYDKQGRQMALFDCSVAKEKAKLPAADTTVTRMVPNPQYGFDPKHWPEVTNVTQPLTIPPGPRNPVGVVWMQLGLPGYGMHGNPKPELIGKTGSHGCFRLTNWDAVTLYTFARPGMTVKIINPERPETP